MLRFINLKLFIFPIHLILYLIIGVYGEKMNDYENPMICFYEQYKEKNHMILLSKSISWLSVNRKAHHC